MSQPNFPLDNILHHKTNSKLLKYTVDQNVTGNMILTQSLQKQNAEINH